MLILAFDTATDLATSALVADGVTLGERTTRPQSLLADVDALLAAAGVSPADLTAIVVGTGPGSFTGTRIGLAVARGLALALDLPVAGCLDPHGARVCCRARVPGRRRAARRGLRPRAASRHARRARHPARERFVGGRRVPLP